MAEKKRVKLSQCPSQNPEVNLTNMLWWYAKRPVNKLMLANHNELKQRCKEEWAKSQSTT